jgi:hypothetical protein
LLHCPIRCLLPNLPSADFVIVQLLTLLPLAAIPYCQPLPAAALLLLSWLFINFAAPVDGGLLHSPLVKQHTN